MENNIPLNQEILEKYVSLYFSSHHDKSRWNGEGENGGAEWHCDKPIAEDIYKAMEEYANRKMEVAFCLGYASKEQWNDTFINEIVSGRMREKWEQAQLFIQNLFKPENNDIATTN